MPGGELCRHRTAAFGAGATGSNASIHVSDALTFARAIGADVGALGAKMLVMTGANDHDMSGGAARFGTGQHQFDVSWLCMLPAEFKAMAGAHLKAGLIASQTFVDTGLHGRVDVMMHVLLPRS